MSSDLTDCSLLVIPACAHGLLGEFYITAVLYSSTVKIN